MLHTSSSKGMGVWDFAPLAFIHTIHCITVLMHLSFHKRYWSVSDLFIVLSAGVWSLLCAGENATHWCELPTLELCWNSLPTLSRPHLMWIYPCAAHTFIFFIQVFLIHTINVDGGHSPAVLLCSDGGDPIWAKPTGCTEVELLIDSCITGVPIAAEPAKV